MLSREITIYTINKNIQLEQLTSEFKTQNISIDEFFSKVKDNDVIYYKIQYEHNKIIVNLYYEKYSTQINITKNINFIIDHKDLTNLELTYKIGKIVLISQPDLYKIKQTMLYSALTTFNSIAILLLLGLSTGVINQEEGKKVLSSATIQLIGLYILNIYLESTIITILSILVVLNTFGQIIRISYEQINQQIN